MANTYFQFKQFTIHQDQCAMKVCTDACLFGAWAADRLLLTANRLPFTAHRSPLATHSFLDIGTGTGLLSLMLAQKNADAIIDAVEIDEAAAQQAKENFAASPWKERLQVYNSSIQQFANSSIRKTQYHLIISNPPFYENDLKSEDIKRNLALHSSELKLEELISIADNLLNDDGNFFVLLPYNRVKDFEVMLTGKFFVKEKMLVKQTAKHGWFRVMWWLVKKEVAIVERKIVIDAAKNYSNEFRELLKEYYLKL